MRKNSQQIYKEILLDEELKKFEHRDLLKKCIDDLLNFRVNELDALIEACELVEDNPILKEWVMSKLIEHTRNLLPILGVTIEGFKMSIEELEEKKREYEKIRNPIRWKIPGKPTETMH